jgi:hypothetical protein
MQEGYWINFRTGKTFEVHEHEQWIRDVKNAKKLGVSASTIGLFGNFVPGKDRDKFLVFIMQHNSVMRARGHGSYVAFEYASRERQDPMDAILLFGKQNLGPFSTLTISNFATKENTQMSFQQFEEEMDSGGAEAVLRIAGATQRIVFNRRIARELLAISKLLLEHS